MDTAQFGDHDSKSHLEQKIKNGKQEFEENQKLLRSLENRMRMMENQETEKKNNADKWDPDHEKLIETPAFREGNKRISPLKALEMLQIDEQPEYLENQSSNVRTPSSYLQHRQNSLVKQTESSSPA